MNIWTRFYTPAFMAALAALPPVEMRRLHVAGTIPRAIYTATGPIIADAYQKLIGRNAGHAEIQAAFAQAPPALAAQYNQTSDTSNVRRLATAWLRAETAQGAAGSNPT